MRCATGCGSTAKRLEGIAAALEAVAALDDPVGRVIDASERPNGLKLSRVRVPLGVIGIIYESRPNVTADAGALALMAGNAAILRGGSEARSQTNAAIHAALADGIARRRPAARRGADDPDQRPRRGGRVLRAQGWSTSSCRAAARGWSRACRTRRACPCSRISTGSTTASSTPPPMPAMAEAVVVNAKLRRTGVCGATETVLLDRGYAHAALAIGRAHCSDAGCALRGDAEACALDPRIAAGGRSRLGHRISRRDLSR